MVSATKCSEPARTDAQSVRPSTGLGAVGVPMGGDRQVHRVPSARMPALSFALVATATQSVPVPTRVGVA